MNKQECLNALGELSTYAVCSNKVNAEEYVMLCDDKDLLKKLIEEHFAQQERIEFLNDVIDSLREQCAMYMRDVRKLQNEILELLEKEND